MIFFLVTYPFLSYKKILFEIFGIFLGKIPESAREFTLLNGTLNILALIVINALILIPTSTIIHSIFKPSPSVTLEEFTTLKGFKLDIFLEDLFARWLLFWVPLTLSKNNIVVFYVFLIFSNFIWAALHLYNYKPEDRRLLLVLPQFLSGIFVLSYAFIKYGFWVCYAVHLFYDFTLLSVFGEEKFEVSVLKNLPIRIIEILIGTILLVGYTNLQTTLLKITKSPYFQWLDGNFVVDSISILSFVGFLMLTGGVLDLICDFVGLDETKLVDVLSERDSLIEKAVFITLISLISVVTFTLMLPILYFICFKVISWGKFILEVKNITLATLILSSFLIASPSGKKSPSAEIRSLIVNFPIFYLLLTFYVLSGFSLLNLLLCLLVYVGLEGIITIIKETL